MYVCRVVRVSATQPNFYPILPYFAKYNRLSGGNTTQQPFTAFRAVIVPK